MYSEALKIMEHNTELYMIDEFRKAKEEAEALVAQKDAASEEKDAALEAQNAEIATPKQPCSQNFQKI